ncbi:MAG: Uma2 family endonuclease [Thiotrichales bacterium]|nr:Uma2 family endonuclease [Thiotrichales bacterium]
MSQASPAAQAVHYPYCDGQPMAESELQLIPMLYLLTALRTHFRHREDVYVGGDMFVYYEEGNPAAVVAPDVFVVCGAPKRADNPRYSYKLWEEPKGPDFVLEVTSESTWAVDLGQKRARYAAMGVAEYWLYDPTGKRLASRLRGMALAGGGYQDLAPEPGTGAMRSAALGLELRVESSGRLRLRDPETGRDLLGHEEQHTAQLAAERQARRANARATLEAEARRVEAAAREKAEVRARREAAARAAAEAKVAELQAQLRERRAESERQQE